MKKILIVPLIFLLTVNIMHASELKDINGHWAEETINNLVSEGIISGFPDNTYRPEEKVTGDQFLTLILKSQNIDFEINSEGYWAEDVLKKSNDLGYTKETIRNYYYEVNRQKVAEILSRVIDEEVFYYDFAYEIEDYNSIDKDKRVPVLKTYALGILNGYQDKTYRPNNNLTRAEVAVIVDRLMNEDKRKQVDLSLNESDVETLKDYPKKGNVEREEDYSKDFKESIDYLGGDVYKILNDVTKSFHLIYDTKITESEFKYKFDKAYGSFEREIEGKKLSSEEYRDVLLEKNKNTPSIDDYKIYIYPSLVYIDKIGNARARVRIIYSRDDKDYKKDYEVEVFKINNNFYINEIHELSEDIEVQKEG